MVSNDGWIIAYCTCGGCDGFLKIKLKSFVSSKDTNRRFFCTKKTPIGVLFLDDFNGIIVSDNEIVTDIKEQTVFNDASEIF